VKNEKGKIKNEKRKKRKVQNEKGKMGTDSLKQ